MTQSLLILNGPGLDKLGTIARDQYGSSTLKDVQRLCERCGAEFGYDIEFRQSNDTGDVLKWIMDARGTFAGLIINPAIATRTEPHIKDAFIAIMHALAYVKLPAVEVHLSNVFVDGDTEQTDISSVSLGLISGFGVQGYEMAIKGLVSYLAGEKAAARTDIAV